MVLWNKLHLEYFCQDEIFGNISKLDENILKLVGNILKYFESMLQEFDLPLQQ